MMTFIARKMGKVIPDIVNQIQTTNSPNASVESKVAHPKTNFTYKQFIACNPTSFTGNDGATTMLLVFRWYRGHIHQ
ncbi:hypothetical protein Hanom_Chr07g00639511 [Helianthus anomalus]